LSDTAMQKIVMNSASDGAIRQLIKEDDREERAFELLNDFFKAVREVFGNEWIGMTPKTSRLRHGAGLVAMGFVMELLYTAEMPKCETYYEKFVLALGELKAHTAWTSGTWNLSENDRRAWNGIQNTPSDIDALSNFLVRSQKRSLRRLAREAA
jgi:hypothetical protein